MRCADLLLPLYLVLSLGSLSACDDPFLVTACKFTMAPEICEKDKLPDMRMQEDGNGSTTDLASPTPPVMKPPVSFTILPGSSLSPPNGTRKWVGMRPGNIILFANQKTGDPITNLEIYHFGPSLADASKLDLLSGPGAGTCLACPIKIQNVDLKMENLLTSKSKMFLVRPDFAYLLSADGSVPAVSINPFNSKLLGDFFYLRPFVSPDADIFIFQRGISSDNTSQVNFYPPIGDAKIVSVDDRTNNPTNTYYYAVGRLDNSRMPETANQLLIFEDKAIKSAYQIDTSNPSGSTRDPVLTNEINQTIIRAKDSTGRLIRSAFIADLNHDGFAEIIYARGPQIYVSSYNPSAQIGSKFTEWPQPNLNIAGIDITLTLTATDLTGDGYPELAVETNNPHMVYFFLNNAQ